MQLIPKWKTAHKLWTVRIAAFWGFLGGLFWVLTAFLNVGNAWILGPIIIVISISLAVARVLHQPGLD